MPYLKTGEILSKTWPKGKTLVRACGICASHSNVHRKKKISSQSGIGESFSSRGNEAVSAYKERKDREGLAE